MILEAKDRFVSIFYKCLIYATREAQYLFTFEAYAAAQSAVTSL